MDLKSHIENLLRKDRFEIPFKNRRGEVLKMVDKYLTNVDGAQKNEETLSFFDIVCVDFYGSGKTRLGNEFINEIKKIRFDEVKTSFDDTFVQKELDLMKKAKTIKIEMNTPYTKQDSLGFFEKLFKQKIEQKSKLKKTEEEREMWEMGFRQNDEPLSIFLVLDEFQQIAVSSNEFVRASAILDLREFRKFLVLKMKEFVCNGNRLYVYMCGRSGVLAEIGSGTGSPTKVAFIQLEALKNEHVKEIISEMPGNRIIPKTIQENVDLLNHFVGQLVEECGVVPRILEMIFLILDYYLKESKLPDPKTKEELDCFLQDKIIDVLVDNSQIPDSIFRLDHKPEARFGVFSSEVGFLLHLCRFEVNVLGRKKVEYEGTSFEKLIGLSFFYCSKKNDEVEHICLSNIYRRRLMELSKKKFSLVNNQPLDDNIYIRHYFLLGLGNLLEYVVARSIIRQNQTEGSKKRWNDLFPSLGDNVEAVFGNSFVYSTKVVDMPKIAKNGKSVESFSSLEDLETYRMLKPDCFRRVLSVLEKEKGIVLLLPGEQSGSSDLYLYYCDVKMLVGIACKDYADNTKFTETIFNEELDKFLPGGLLKKECHEVRTFVLIVCCTNVDYLKEEWVTSTFHSGNDGIYGVEFDVEGGGKNQNFIVYTLLLDEMGLKKFLSDEDLQSVIDFREKKKQSRAFDFVKATLERRERRMEDEESETKMFKVFSFIKNTNADVHLKKKSISQSALLQHFYKQCGGRYSPKKKRAKKREMKDEEDEEEGEFPWDKYSIYGQDFTLLPSFDAVWKKHDGDELYFLTDSEKKLKEEEEARKLKEEEEARKLKEEEEARKLKEELKEDESVRLYFVDSKYSCEEVFFDVYIGHKSEYHDVNIREAIRKFKKEEDFREEKNVDEKSKLFIFEYNVGIFNRWVGKKYGMNRPCSSLVGQIMFFVTEDEKKKINEGRIKFVAGSGMSFLDKWFDDEDEEKGVGAITVDQMKNEDSKWKKDILLECCDGLSLRKNMEELLQNSRFFRKMINFNGKEAREAREDGKIKLEFLTSLELEYYLKVISDVEEDTEVGGSDSNRIRLLLRLLEFGMRYQERKLAEKVVNELETQIFPDLVSCGVLDLRLMELGHIVHGRLPNGLLEELLDRLCSQKNVGEEANKMMRYIEYSSQVMEKAHTFLEEGGKGMLDEDCVQIDYGVGEVVSGNGNVLDQCFMGEFGGRSMVWNDASNSSFVGCLKDSTLERTLIKTKRRREEEYSVKMNCVGEGKVRKLMDCDEIESFLRK